MGQRLNGPAKVPADKADDILRGRYVTVRRAGKGIDSSAVGAAPLGGRADGGVRWSASIIFIPQRGYERLSWS